MAFCVALWFGFAVGLIAALAVWGWFASGCVLCLSGGSAGCTAAWLVSGFDVDFVLVPLAFFGLVVFSGLQFGLLGSCVFMLRIRFARRFFWVLSVTLCCWRAV